MAEEIYIDTIEKLEEHLLFKQTYDKELGRYRDLCLYRGMPNASFELKTSLQRNCKHKKNELEYTLLSNFAKYAELEEPSIIASVWRKMIIGQHHGLSTRLLDWTRSPLVALHFATTEDMDSIDQHDCVVWKIDVDRLNEELPDKYNDVIGKSNKSRIFTVDMLNSVYKEDLNEKQQLEQYDKDMGDKSLVILEPPSIDPRIVNQYSFFAVIPAGIDRMEDLLEKYPNCYEKYVISKNLKWQIRDMLDQANVNERIIYPGLDGIAKWTSRHYFVRELNRLRIEKIDIVNTDVDAIVNPTNEELKAVGAVCKSIFNAAGTDKLQKECEQYGVRPMNDVVKTEGYDLKAKYIFHAVVPVYSEFEKDKSKDNLKELYRKVLEEATIKENRCRSIAFPLMGAGYNRYPKEDAWRIALETCHEYQEKIRNNPKAKPLDITFCVIDEDTYKMGMRVLQSIQNKSNIKQQNEKKQ